MWRLMAVLFDAVSLSSEAQERFVTLTVIDNKGGFFTKTNSFALDESETAELVSAIPLIVVQRDPNAPGGTLAYLTVEKDGGTFAGYHINLSDDTLNQATGSRDRPLIVNGPCKFNLIGTSGLVTFKVTPTAYPPGKTAIVLPGPGGADVQMECSTDLVHWTVAAPGVYTNQPAAKFFRVTLKKI